MASPSVVGGAVLSTHLSLWVTYPVDGRSVGGKWRVGWCGGSLALVSGSLF